MMQTEKDFRRQPVRKNRGKGRSSVTLAWVLILALVIPLFTGSFSYAKEGQVSGGQTS